MEGEVDFPDMDVGFPKVPKSSNTSISQYLISMEIMHVFRECISLLTLFGLMIG